MTNPLKSGDGTSFSGGRYFTGEGHMRSWCSEKNREAEKVGWKRWLFIDTLKHDDGSDLLKIVELTGHDADDVLGMRNGRPLTPTGWDDSRVAGFHRALRHKLRRGMIEGEYQAWIDREQARSSKAPARELV